MGIPEFLNDAATHRARTISENLQSRGHPAQGLSVFHNAEHSEDMVNLVSVFS
jgi:hypothetical protein